MSEELRKSLVIGGTRYALAVGQAGEGPPGEDTPGKVGVTYLDTAADPPVLYACTAAVRDGERIRCSWAKVGGAGEDSGQNQAGGISPEAASLLITILRGCVKYGNLTPQIDALEVLLTAGSTAPPEQGVTENGKRVIIISGVTVEEDGDTLIIK